MSEYKILVKVFHKKYSVCYTMELWNQGESAQMQILYNKGNEFSRWGEEEWETIIRNLQIDMKRSLCNVIVFSDGPIEAPKEFQGSCWSREGIAKARRIGDIHARKWNLNGVDLTVSKWNKYLPTEEGNDIVYITTFPEYSIATEETKEEDGSKMYQFMKAKAEGK